MTMTNEQGRKIKETVRENIDLSTDLTQNPAPQPDPSSFTKTIAAGQNYRTASGHMLSPEAQIMFDKSIIARDISTPANEEIQIMNLAYHYLWANRLSGGGMMYAKRKAAGWTNATTNDVKPLAVELTQDSGEIRFGDLILMKLPVQTWMEREKAKMTRALALQRKTVSNVKMVDRLPSTDVLSEDTLQTETVKDFVAPGGKQYMNNFLPSEAELTKKMGADNAAGR